MTPETPDDQAARLGAIRGRAAAIIPGPWQWYGNTATHQIYLATSDRGRLVIITPQTEIEEYVYDHYAGESYTMEQARNHVIEWCGAHDEDSNPDTREADCRCDEIREFLRVELNPSGDHAEYVHGERDRQVVLTRAQTIHADLRFPVAEDEERRKEHGGLLRSYKDLARYEVLGKLNGHFRPPFRSRKEFEAATGEPADHALYREDIIGLAQAEADFIAHSASDIPWLLSHIASLAAELKLYKAAKR